MPKISRNFAKQRELIHKIPLLKDFSEEHKEVLAKMFYFEEFEAGEKIIEENGICQKLYFLIRGQVDVMAGEEKIISLRGGGRLFGEVSFVNQSFTSASVVAETPVVMMFLSTTDFIGMDQSKYGSLLIELYKMIAGVLASKLQKTTEQAKTFQSLAHSDEIS